MNEALQALRDAVAARRSYMYEVENFSFLYKKRSPEAVEAYGRLRLQNYRTELAVLAAAEAVILKHAEGQQNG